MARKAARLVRSGHLEPRDRMWAAIRDLRARAFSAVEIQYLANLKAPCPAAQSHVDSVQSYLEGLSRATPRYLEPSSEPCLRGELQQYRLLRDVGIDAPRVTREGKPVTQGAGNEAMWAAMRVLAEFDAAELAAAASSGTVNVSHETAKAYCTWLCRAQYLVLHAPHRGPHARARYRFNRAKNTGPRAPLITTRKEVIDGNTGAVVYEHKKPGGKGCQART